MILEYSTRLSNGRHRKCFIDLSNVSMVDFVFNAESPDKLDSISFEVQGSVPAYVSAGEVINANPRAPDVTNEEHAQAEMNRIYMTYRQYVRSRNQVLPQA